MSAIEELNQLKFDITDNCWYDLEDELRILDNIDKALLSLEKHNAMVGQVAYLHQENQLLKKENAK